MPTFAPRDLAIKTTLPPDRIVPAVRAIVRRADPQEPVSDVQLLSDVVSRETLSREDQLRAVMAFAAMAALLAGADPSLASFRLLFAVLTLAAVCAALAGHALPQRRRAVALSTSP